MRVAAGNRPAAAATSCGAHRRALAKGRGGHSRAIVNATNHHRRLIRKSDAHSRTDPERRIEAALGPNGAEFVRCHRTRHHADGDSMRQHVHLGFAISAAYPGHRRRHREAIDLNGAKAAKENKLAFLWAARRDGISRRREGAARAVAPNADYPRITDDQRPPHGFTAIRNAAYAGPLSGGVDPKVMRRAPRPCRSSCSPRHRVESITRSCCLQGQYEVARACRSAVPRAHPRSRRGALSLHSHLAPRRSRIRPVTGRIKKKEFAR